MALEYTIADTDLLRAIYDDILARPAFYADGEEFLRVQYSPKRLHEQAMHMWKQRDAAGSAHCETLGLDQGAPGKQSKGRARRRREISTESPSRERAPKLDDWTHAKRACHAVRELFTETQGCVYTGTRAKAMLIMAVLLWHTAADRAAPIFNLFGEWGIASDGKVTEVKGARWAAFSLFDEARLRRWMELVQVAWAGVAKPAASPRDDDGHRVEIVGVKDGRGSRKGIGGRPGLSYGDERRRLDILGKWDDTKGQRSQKEFCDDEGISLKYLATCVNWRSTNNRRSGQ